jgi:hypothetical protein
VLKEVGCCSGNINYEETRLVGSFSRFIRRRWMVDGGWWCIFTNLKRAVAKGREKEAAMDNVSSVLIIEYCSWVHFTKEDGGDPEPMILPIATRAQRLRQNRVNSEPCPCPSPPRYSGLPRNFKERVTRYVVTECLRTCLRTLS